MSKAAGEVVPVTSSNGTSGNGKAVKKGLPLLFMRTVILAVQGFPELKQYVAVGLLPRYAYAMISICSMYDCM
jgi:Symplekin tight junction protein C terminal